MRRPRCSRSPPSCRSSSAPSPFPSRRPARSLALSAAVERALGRYPSVAAARSRVDEATATLGEAEASRGPLLRFGMSALQYDDPMITSPIHSFHPTAIPPFSETLVQGSLSVSYTLFDAGTTRGTRQASA